MVYLDTSKTTVLGYIGDSTDIIIPTTVTTIADHAFENNTTIETVTIDGYVYSPLTIGNYAFSNSTIENIIITRSGPISSMYVTIGDYAFYRCSNLSSFSAWRSVHYCSITSIGDYAFAGCRNLTTIDGCLMTQVEPQSLTHIGDYAFAGCGMTHVMLPAEVESIGRWVFADCRNLTSLNVVAVSQYFRSDGNCIVERSSNKLISTCQTSQIPYYTRVIGLGSLWYNGMQMVDIPEGVKKIEAGAFSGLHLSHLSLPSSLDTISSASFGVGYLGYTDSIFGVYIDSIISHSVIPPYVMPYNRFNIEGMASYDIPFIVPCESVSAYENNIGWNVFTNIHGENCPFIVTVISSNDSMGIVSGSGSYNEGDTVTLTATANSGYQFNHWSDGNTENPRSLIVTQDTTIEALFEIATYTITVGNAIGGGIYTHGSTAMLAAFPQVDLQFAGWSDGETANPRYIVITSDTTLSALYRAPDTVRVYDTTTVYDTVVNMIYDTVINIVYDTTEFHHVIYDTMRVFDTTLLVNVDTLNHYYYQYDTTRVFDTVVLVNVDTLNHYYYQYDTTRVFDTVVLVNVDTLNHYYYQYDTTRVFDTLVLVNVDTLNHYFYQYDTTEITHYIFDSTWMFDSVWVFDSVYISDTIYIHDTIYISHEGIDGADALSAKIYQRNGQVVVEGADGNIVTLYDVNGRALATKQDDNTPLLFDVPVSGTYMIRIGNYPARKVVVIR